MKVAHERNYTLTARLDKAARWNPALRVIQFVAGEADDLANEARFRNLAFVLSTFTLDKEQSVKVI